MIITKSIRNVNAFLIIDEITEKIYYGGHQEWYPTIWQRKSGCGPTVVSNIVYYLSQRNACVDPSKGPRSKSQCVELMQDVWKYVTPSLRGIPTTEMLRERVERYAQSKGMTVIMDYLDIPEKERLRPTFPALLAFLDQALSSDTPVAFLNLNSGAEKKLDSWHWVTILSLEYAEDASTAFIEIADQGAIIKIDLRNWFRTTTLGGGFVSFSLA
jgi:hypothetical protein